ncbi:hypothetical protein Tco_1034707 [Tanacetum coccineum]
MTTLAEHMIVAGGDNRPPILEKTSTPLGRVVFFGKGESLHEYYLQFAQLMNDMNIIGMTMQQVQVNSKFLNTLPPEWSKFVTDVKLPRNMHTTKYDQLYAYLSQHEAHATKVHLMRERFPDPLALIANNSHIPSYQTNHQSQYNPTQYQQQSSLVVQQHYPSQQHSQSYEAPFSLPRV